VAWNDFIPTAFMHNMTWGDMACYNLDVSREMAATGCMARIWEEDDSVMSTD
jgi:F420-dependent methylenetetrahydromethanopterin dehydrogenase